MLIRADDTVVVKTGADKGEKQRVLRVLLGKGKVVVEKVNMVKKHVRPSQRNPQGGRLEKEMPVDVSNVIYAGSKGAIVSLTKTAAQQLGKYNINVNAICPAPTYTDIVEKLIKTRAYEQKKSKDEIIKHYMRDVPLGRFNDPEDIAELALFLSSDSSKNISGQSFNVDGGLIPS